MMDDYCTIHKGMTAKPSVDEISKKSCKLYEKEKALKQKVFESYAAQLLKVYSNFMLFL